MFSWRANRMRGFHKLPVGHVSEICPVDFVNAFDFVDAYVGLRLFSLHIIQVDFVADGRF